MTTKTKSNKKIKHTLGNMDINFMAEKMKADDFLEKFGDPQTIILINDKGERLEIKGSNLAGVWYSDIEQFDDEELLIF
ncbi:hypothetical protein J8TS2_28030 [Lederbergia ruris]|uniref:Uncharacterized protein n=1 Tax=Lederbergia ruris TaxID=217495 RepID=A0ABQ4KLW1_9BACI|nr:hypothetical protein [Lederbergia ruris]GIN58484.1 hypothetical protein J8TS2_28030 [Lederbergia ruris]